MTPKQKRKLIDFIPDRWFTEKENSSVWLSAYHVIRVSKDDISPGANIIDLDDVLIIVGFFEGLRYLTMDEVAIISHPNGKYAFKSKIDEKTLPDGMYSILMTPFNVNGEEGNESVTRERLSIAISLMDIFIGRNIIFWHIFDTIVFGDGKKTTTISPVAEWPDWFPKPDLKQKNIDLIQRSSKKIRNLDKKLRNRIILSLRWFYSAIYDIQDAFLKYWFAIETLGTNKESINELLSRIYNFSSEDIDKFAINKIWTLRSKVVHGGLIVPNHAYLLQYLEALYIDLFLEILGFTPQHRAKKVLCNETFDLRAYIDDL